VAPHGRGRRRVRLRGHELRPRSHHRRDRRLRRHGRERHRRHRAGRPHVARWNGSAWSALGADSGGENGWLPTSASIEDLAGVGSNLFVTGTFQNANGDARADNVAFFDGTEWHPVGSDGAGDGPWIGNGLALALVDRQLYAAGSFTSAGGDPQARSAASFALTQIIAYKKLVPGKHVFRVKARDRAGNLDATPVVKRFKIKKR
jgi:hypothetical protein